MISKSGQDNSQMLFMILLVLGVHQNVIDEHNHELIQFWHENCIHQKHKVCRSIYQAKGHHKILIQPVSGEKCGFRYILGPNLDLMITRSQIYLGEHLSLG